MHLICCKSGCRTGLRHRAGTAAGTAPAAAAPSLPAGGGAAASTTGGRAAFKMIKVDVCRDNETPTKRRKFQLNVKAKQILTLLALTLIARELDAKMRKLLLQTLWPEPSLCGPKT